MDRKLIGQYLVDTSKISADQLQRALELQALQLGSSTPLIGTVLVQLGAVQEQDVTEALKMQQSERTM